MLDLEFIEPSEIDRAATVFHRDGLAVVTDALTDEEFAFLKDGAHRVVAEQTQCDFAGEGEQGFCALFVWFADPSPRMGDAG